MPNSGNPGNFNPLKTRNPLTGTLIDSDDPVEMLHVAAFYLGLHCLSRQNRSSKKHILGGKYNPSTMDHPDLIVALRKNALLVPKGIAGTNSFF